MLLTTGRSIYKLCNSSSNFLKTSIILSKSGYSQKTFLASLYNLLLEALLYLNMFYLTYFHNNIVYPNARTSCIA